MFLRSKSTIPSPDEALAGRTERGSTSAEKPQGPRRSRS